MKTTLLVPFTVACLLASAYAADRVPRNLPETVGLERATTDLPLYLHLLAPRYYTDPPTPARRILTARIYLSDDFEVTLDGDPNTTLAGRVDREGRKFVAHHLSGMCHTTKNLFEGEMELDKPAHSTSGMFSGAFFSAVFVLSTNADSAPLLKKIDPDAFKSDSRTNR